MRVVILPWRYGLSSLLGLLGLGMFLRLLLAKDSVPVVRPLLLIDGSVGITFPRAVSSVFHMSLHKRERQGVLAPAVVLD